jgi:hypothetical protein
MRCFWGALLILLTLPGALSAQSVLDRAEYADRLRAMWLGQCIANWTGLRTEGARVEPPFFTDEDWGTIPPGMSLPIDFVLWLDPWPADDDTDIEYVYLHLMSKAKSPWLSPAQIRDGWLTHMDPAFIWVSNYRAWQLMGENARPPATGLEHPNWYCYHIDAQLTTEFFGALAPRMPGAAMRLADLPIRTTASGHAAHAAQFFAALYALAMDVDPQLPGRQRAIWLVQNARRWIPQESKAQAAVALVLNDFLANPDVNDWERTRDLIYEHFQLHAAANGWLYRGWTESTVNFACGVMALLYGQCDFKRTVQIGTLSGWDSDNCTATMGGLLGLMLGTDALRAQFPGWTFSDRFDIARTRNNLPDYLPNDPEADDTFTMMALRMLPLIDQVVEAAGGAVDLKHNRWILPDQPRLGPPHASPSWSQFVRSANNTVRARGGSVSAASAPAPPGPGPSGSPNPALFANGLEMDFSGRESWGQHAQFFSSQGAGYAPGQILALTVTYSLPVAVERVRLIEGPHSAQGGWFESLSLDLWIAGVWAPQVFTLSEPLDPARPYQVIDLVLDAPLVASGIRVSGPPGGTGKFVTCLELDALAPAERIPGPAIPRP